MRLWSWDIFLHIFLLHAAILNRSFALHFYWKYHSFHGFILFLASLFVAQRSKYRYFKVPKPFLQFRNVLLRYRHIKCIYTNYIWHRRYLGHQIDNLCGALLPFLVHGSGVAPILVSLCYHWGALDLTLFLFRYGLGKCKSKGISGLGSLDFE